MRASSAPQTSSGRAEPPHHRSPGQQVSPAPGTRRITAPQASALPGCLPIPAAGHRDSPAPAESLTLPRRSTHAFRWLEKKGPAAQLPHLRPILLTAPLPLSSPSSPFPLRCIPPPPPALQSSLPPEGQWRIRPPRGRRLRGPLGSQPRSACGRGLEGRSQAHAPSGRSRQPIRARRHKLI